MRVSHWLLAVSSFVHGICHAQTNYADYQKAEVISNDQFNQSDGWRIENYDVSDGWLNRTQMTKTQVSVFIAAALGQGHCIRKKK